jgi:hypothetical protein
MSEIIPAALAAKKKRRSKKRKKRADAGVKRGPKSLATTSEAPQPSRKAKRVPFGGFVDKLAVENKDPNYFYFWHRDRFDELSKALQAGYRFVDPRDTRSELPEALQNVDLHAREDGRLAQHGGVGEFGKSYKLVLMRLPMELHEQDLKARQVRADAVDLAIHRREFEGGKIVDNMYGDTSGITTKVGEDADKF